MKKKFLVVLFLLVSVLSYSQLSSKEYNALINKGRSFYRGKDYSNAATTFSASVLLGGDLTPVIDRHRAAFCWALAGNPDSAFYYLNTITKIESLTFENYRWVAEDEDYTSIHNDPRWKTSLDKLFNKAQINFYKMLETADEKTAIAQRNNAGLAWLVHKGYDSAFYHFNVAADSKEFAFDAAFNLITDDLFIALEKDKRQQDLKNKIFLNLYKIFIPSSAFSKTAKSSKRLLIDGGHHNLHNLSGTYATLGGTLRHCGFEVSGHNGKFDEASLENTGMLIISNPLSDRLDSLEQRAQRANEPLRWATDATQSAYTNEEIIFIEKWVRNGGSLLLILDHAPYGKSGGSLAAAFGVECRNVGTYDALHRDPLADTTRGRTIIFTRSNGLIGKHPILNGVDSVRTSTGESLLGPSNSDKLLILPSTATDQDWVPETKEYRNRSAAGRSQGIAFEYGKGRVVVLGEAAQTRPGILSRSDRGNWKFILNILRWLAREKMD